MAGLLADIFSYGDTLKRKTKGLLDDPRGTLEQFVGQLGDSINQNSALSDQSGLGVGKKPFVSVLADSRPSIGYEQNPIAVTPQQMQYARDTLAEQGSQNAMAAATVWHGSPHKFDKFDASKIGTGEGAQAYGHGLYLAENPSVATEYSKMGSGAGGAIPSPLRFINGQEVQTGTGAYKAASLLDSMSVAQAKKTVSGWLQGARPEEQAYFKEVADTLSGITSKSAVKQKAPGGSLYKVDLPDEHIAKMLDWDKPLSQQTPEVQAAANKLGINDASNGEDLLWKIKRTKYSTREAMQGNTGLNDAGAFASEQLKAQGIPGIRYLDGGSRGAGQGSSNFVVFPGNEGLLNILERNGQSIGGLLK